MQAYQIYQAVSPELQQEITGYMQTQHGKAFEMVVATMAQVWRVRPQFILNKPAADQLKWVNDRLRIKANDGLSEQVIQVWLLKGQQEMLKTFLDAVGIEHKDGEVEQLPETITAAKAKAGIAALLKDYPGEKVAVYMHMFQRQRPGGWDTLAKAIEAAEELKLTPKA